MIQYNKFYQVIANTLYARNHWLKQEDKLLYYRSDDVERTIHQLNDLLPSGSGFDNGTIIDMDCKNPFQKFDLVTCFHHMDGNGYYAGWNDYTVTVKACMLSGFSLHIKGRDYNGFKEYAYEMFDELLHRHMRYEKLTDRWAFYLHEKEEV